MDKGVMDAAQYTEITEALEAAPLIGVVMDVERILRAIRSATDLAPVIRFDQFHRAYPLPLWGPEIFRIRHGMEFYSALGSNKRFNSYAMRRPALTTIRGAAPFPGAGGAFRAGRV